MSCIYVSGYYGNAIRRATLSSSSAHADYPLTDLQTGLPSLAFRFNAQAANDHVTADLDFVIYGDFETWTAATMPDGWTEHSGAGSCEEEETIVDTGSSALQLDGDYTIYRDVTVQTGMIYGVIVALYGDDANNTSIRVQDMDTLQWLKSDGDWQAASTEVFTRSAASWNTETEVSFTVATDTTQATRTLRIYCDQDAGTGYVDELAMYPEVNFCAVVGHNLPSGVTISWRRDTAAFAGAGTEIAEMTMGRQAFFEVAGSDQLYRYHRVRVAEADDMKETIWYGEWVLGYSATLGQMHRSPRTIEYEMPSVRVVSSAGQGYSTKRAVYPSRSLALSFRTKTEANVTEVLEDIFGASDYGDEPLIVVPDDSDTEVYHVRVGNGLTVENHHGIYWDYEVELVEDRYPIPF